MGRLPAPHEQGQGQGRGRRRLGRVGHDVRGRRRGREHGADDGERGARGGAARRLRADAGRDSRVCKVAGHRTRQGPGALLDRARRAQGAAARELEALPDGRARDLLLQLCDGRERVGPPVRRVLPQPLPRGGGEKDEAGRGEVQEEGGKEEEGQGARVHARGRGCGRHARERRRRCVAVRADVPGDRTRTRSRRALAATRRSATAQPAAAAVRPAAAGWATSTCSRRTR